MCGVMKQSYDSNLNTNHQILKCSFSYRLWLSLAKIIFDRLTDRGPAGSQLAVVALVFPLLIIKHSRRRILEKIKNK